MTNEDEKSPTDPNYVYNLPPIFAVALQASRPSMLNLLLGELKAGKTKLNKTMQVELVKLLQGLLADNLKLKRRVANYEDGLVELQTKLSQATQTQTTIHTALDAVRKENRRIDEDRPLEDA